MRHFNLTYVFVALVATAARVRRQAVVAAFVAAFVSLAVAAPSRGAGGTPPPLIGATYTHTSLSGCSLELTGLVLGYNTPGVRRLARSQLRAMHAAGLQTIRVLLWNMTDITGAYWGIVPSAGGRLVEPYRSNLIRLVSDITAAGFSALTVSLGPEWTNNPSGEYGISGLTADRWDPSKFDENWGLMEDVHKLVKAVGPAITHFDFIQEGAPSDYQPRFIVDRLKNYIATMWTRYVPEFGKDDVTVAVIAKGTTGSFNDRLQNLIDAFRSTGLGFPAYFEVHPDWTSPAAYNDLVAVDQTLRANGLLTQPLVIGESSYENAAVAADIARFQHDTGRPIAEVYEWWATSEGGACASAPYRADAYITALTGAPIPPPTPSPLPLLPVPRLTASLTRSGRTSLKGADGRTITALDAGTYRLVIRDHSRRAGFRLIAGGLKIATSKAFTGTRVWRGDIGSDAPYGATARYGSTARKRALVAFSVH